MKKYEVINRPMTFPEGVELGLTGDQVRRRSHCLRAKSEYVYLTTATVMFKVGEIVQYGGEMPKSHHDRMRVMESKKETPKEEAPKEKEAEVETAPEEEVELAPELEVPKEVKPKGGKKKKR